MSNDSDTLAASAVLAAIRSNRLTSATAGLGSVDPYRFARTSSAPVAEYIGIPCLLEVPQWKTQYCPGGFDCLSIVPSVSQAAAIQPRIITSTMPPVTQGAQSWSGIVVFRAQGKTPAEVEAFSTADCGKISVSSPTPAAMSDSRSTWMVTVQVTHTSRVFTDWEPFEILFRVTDQRGFEKSKKFDVDVA